MQASFEPNPRAVAGGNFPPPDDEDDKSEPTPEEITAVYKAICYVQFKRPGLEDLLVKRKGNIKMGWRHLIANSLKTVVRQNSLAKILKLNRKTMGENQQRPDAWADYDDEHGTGEFSCLLADIRDAILADAKVDVQGLETYLKAFIKLDPELRRIEEQARACENAAKEAEAAAEALEAKQRAREANEKREARTKAVAKALKGVAGKSAIVAQHQGAARLAKSLTDAAIEVVETLTKLEARGVRKGANAYDKDGYNIFDAEGLKLCFKRGLVREGYVHLQAAGVDPPIAPTDLCQRVFVEAVKIGRISVKKPKKAE